MKDAKNGKRNSGPDTLFAKVEALFQSPDIESRTKDAEKLTKKAVQVTDDFLPRLSTCSRITTLNVFMLHMSLTSNLFTGRILGPLMVHLQLIPTSLLWALQQ